VSAAEQNVLIAGLKGLTKQTSAARATEATNAKIMSYLVTEQVKTSATTNSLIQKLNNIVDKLPENIANELKAQMGGSTTPATMTTQDILNLLRIPNFRPGFGDVQEF
jgi:hypothetical protein